MQDSRPPFQLTGDFSQPFNSMGLMNTVDTQMCDGFQKLDINFKPFQIVEEEQKQTPLEIATEMNRVIFSKKHDKSNMCGICHAEIRNKAMEVTPCGHYYHPSCLMKWRFEYQRTTCPMCRSHIQTQNRPTSGGLQLAETRRTIPIVQLIYNHDQPDLSGERADLVEIWDIDDPHSAIHMLPRRPNIADVESLFHAMSTPLFELDDEESPEEIANRWTAITSTTWHLPSTMRRWRYRWSDDPTRWFRFVFVQDHDWYEETPSLDIYNEDYPQIGWDANLSPAQRDIYRERYSNVPELLIELNHDLGTITVIQIWIPQLPGTLPSIEGGLSFPLRLEFSITDSNGNVDLIPSTRSTAFQHIREQIVVRVEEELLRNIFNIGFSINTMEE